MTLKLNGSSSGSVSIDAPASTTGGADVTFALPVADGSSGQALTTNASGQLAFATAGLFSSYAIICDQKDSTTDGGTFTTGAWRTRDLNTEISDPDSIVSISSNQFTLQAGNYLIKWRAPAYDCTRHVTRLYDVTNSALRQYGAAAYTNSSDQVVTTSDGFARVTPTGATAYEIQHSCQESRADYGLGVASEINASGDHDSGTTEGYSIYTVVEIYKEA